MRYLFNSFLYSSIIGSEFKFPIKLPKFQVVFSALSNSNLPYTYTIIYINISINLNIKLYNPFLIFYSFLSSFFIK